MGRAAIGRVGLGGSLDDALWEVDDDAPATEASAEDAAALDVLRESFLRSEWAQLRPLEVETEIDFTDRWASTICRTS